MAKDSTHINAADDEHTSNGNGNANGSTNSDNTDKHTNDNMLKEQSPDINDLLPEDLLADDERVIFALKPSGWMILFFSFRVLVIAVVIAVGVMELSRLVTLGPYSSYIIQLCGAGILMRVGFAFLQWLSRSYVLTDRRVIRIQGVFTINIFQCSLSRIQNTFLQMSFYERFFGLGSISFTTAGTAAIEATWQHISCPSEVHHKLLNAMNKICEKEMQKNIGQDLQDLRF